MPTTIKQDQLGTIDADSVNGQTIGTGPNQIVQRDGSGNVVADTAGNANQLSGQTIGTGPNQIVQRDGSGNIGGVVQQAPTGTNHIQAGSDQLVDGTQPDEPFLDIAATMPTNLFQTVGPTGSGATHIWTALDSLPSNTRVVKVLVYGSIDSSGGLANFLQCQYVGGAALPGVVSLGARILYLNGEINEPLSGIMLQAEIPCDTNQMFQIHWNKNAATTAVLRLYKRGYITE